jgi:hypothetical protein
MGGVVDANGLTEVVWKCQGLLYVRSVVCFVCQLNRQSFSFLPSYRITASMHNSNYKNVLPFD